MKIFEIPYNFDKKLIDGLQLIDPSANLYHSIYIPPYYRDYISAKYYYNHPIGKDMKILHSLSREEYISHIDYIKNIYPNKLMLLLQQTDFILNKNFIQYYINLGFTKFCVGSIKQAKLIKDLLPSAEITGSITMKLSYNDFVTNLDLKKYFDNFVLWFPYNRDFQLIRQLPKHFNYVLLVNCNCSIHCLGSNHWFANKDYEEHITLHCPKIHFNHEWSDLIKIRPMDLDLFTSNITYFKLQGREYNTEDILKDICVYSYDYSTLPNLNIAENIYNKKSKEESL